MALGAGFGSLGYAFVRRHRAVALREMARCFPDASARVLCQRLHDVYRSLGMNYVEVFRWAGGRHVEMESRVRMADEGILRAAMARGRGVLVLTAHTGNWDLMALWAARRFPLTIISKELRQEGVNRFWMEVRRGSGLNIVPAHNSYRACLGVLRKGGVLGFILDQNMIRAEGIFVDFFGKQACTSPGLAFMAAHAQVPVVPAFMLRDPDGTHRIQVLPALDPPADREPATIHEATQRYTAIIEGVIRQHPGQWIWMHRRWRTTPPAVERAVQAKV